MLNNGNRSRRDGRLVAVLCQRFTGKKDLFFGDTGHGRRRIARSFRTPIVVTARLPTTIVISARVAALRRRVFRGRQIAPSGTTLWASAAMASAKASPTSTAAAISATVGAAIPTTAKILSGTIIAAAGRIVLRWVVMRREILGRGRIGIRLALLCRVSVLLFHGSRRKRVVMFQVLSLRGGNVFVGSVLFIYGVGFVLMELLGTSFFVVFVGSSQRFTWQHFYRGTDSRGQRSHRSP